MDMLVRLYGLRDGEAACRVEDLSTRDIRIKRAMPQDKHHVVGYVREKFGDGWASECEVCFSNHPVSCFIAAHDDIIVGFACYETTTRDFFGPTGVSKEYRSTGIGAALLLKCLLSMREMGYGYAIIGGVEEADEFYRKVCGATPISDSFPGVYENVVGIEKVVAAKQRGK